MLLRELRARNYTGSYTLLTNWLRPQRSAARVVAVRRFETASDKQAQVDWGHLDTLEMAGQVESGHTTERWFRRRGRLKNSINEKEQQLEAALLKRAARKVSDTSELPGVFQDADRCATKTSGRPHTSWNPTFAFPASRLRIDADLFESVRRVFQGAGRIADGQ